MRKGLLFTQLPFLDSPALQDALDNAPLLSGLELSAPLLSTFSTDGAKISSDTVETFATSPSLLRAVLRYILHYEFDVPEFVQLLETLEEIVISASTKEDQVDLFSKTRTLRDFDITSLSTGAPPETSASFNASDISTQIGSGGILELLFTAVAPPIIAKVPGEPLTDFVNTLSDSRPAMHRKPDLGNDVFHIPSIDLTTGRGEAFSIQQAPQLLEEFFVHNKQPSIFVGNILFHTDSLASTSSETLGYGIGEEFAVGLAGSGDDAEGFLYCDPRILPSYREHFNSFSNLLSVNKVLPGGSTLSDSFFKSEEPRKKWARDVGYSGLNFTLDSAGNLIPLSPEVPLVDYTEYKAGTLSTTRILSNKELLDLLNIEVSKPLITKNPRTFNELIASLSFRYGFNIGTRPTVSKVGTESEARKRIPSSPVESLETRNFVGFKGKTIPPRLDKFKIKSTRRTNKIILDFVIEKTFYSIHSDLAGLIVSASNGDFVWVDLGEKFDKIIYHPSVTLNDDGEPIDENGEIYTPPNGDGWPASAFFYLKNERYVQTSARTNMGRFRQGRESAVYPEYRDRYGSSTAQKLGRQIRQNDNSYIFTDDALFRFAERATAASDAERIRGEGGEFLSIYFGSDGFGYQNAYGPAPRNETYGTHGAGGFNPPSVWNHRGGVYYPSYIHTITHQDSGRRTNLLLREMTDSDKAISNLYNGKKKISTGPTFIDRMLEHQFWSKLFKMIEGLVQIQANHIKEDSAFTKSTLSTVAVGPNVGAPSENLKIGFLHRYESVLLAEPLFDIDLKYTYNLTQEKFAVDGHRYWPYNVSPLFRPQPADWDAKVRLKNSLETEDFYATKMLKALVLNGAIRFELDKVFTTAVRDANKVGKNKEDVFFIPPVTFEPIVDAAGVAIGFKFVKGETTTKAQGRPLSDNMVAELSKAIVALAPRQGIYKDKILSNDSLITRPFAAIKDNVGVKLDQGFSKQTGQTTDENGNVVPVITFFAKPKMSQQNTILNEVTAADSGTAFVPGYCLPSYFMETYVGEDGKYANF